MSNLFELDLSWNRLVYLEEGMFDGLASLRKLFLNGNYLNYSLKIPNDIFKPLVSLTYLNVAYNLLFREGYLFYTFPGDLLLPLVRLYKIEVDVRPRFQFFQFAEEYRTLTNLKRLKTGFCVLHHLTNITFTNLLYLEYIEMQTCWIQKFDRGTIPNRNYFRYLDISHNELSDYDHDSLYSLMKELSFFKELRGLKMTNSFPFVYIFKPGYLTFFLKSTKIEKLYVNNNSLVEAIGNNQLFMMPPTLRVCDFSNNRLSKFYFGMPYLSMLNLRNNTLGAYLSSKRYTNSSKTELREIDLSHNLIQDLSFDIFHGHAHAVKINLSHNKLLDVSFDLSHLVSLERLDLSYNNISGITSKIAMDSLHKLSKTSNLTIDLSNNLLKCSCQNLKFLQWMYVNLNLLFNTDQYMCQFVGNGVVHMTNVEKIVKQLEKECSSYTTVIICITTGILLACVILVAGLVYRYR
ncbi:unnamed protein product [Mytilus edulis]|uniref:Uncharacterized protein n=1 Tax=Mytilus edulis TaxID=6550 RepID=A0A8S3RH90_MYTED|nr:unnamed protein product [Mytilus edulis]